MSRRHKVSAPADARGVLARARLEDRLDEGLARRVTLVTAAPGLGKTTLLAGWARRPGCAWYCVGPEDRDPAVLARGLLEAARVRVPSLDPAAIAPSEPGPGWTIPSEGQGSLAADQLVGMLAERLDTDLALVLDDVHEIDGAEACWRLLQDLIREGPSRLHLVMSSRVEPPFGLARLRAQGLALDVTGSALRFTEAETAAVVTGVLGAEGEPVARLLHRETAGWPAAVRIVSEWLREASAEQWPAMVRRASEAGGPLRAFLVEEVLPATPDAVLGLLRAVGSLERFTTALALELVGGEVEELVDLLVRGGLWIVPDPKRQGWFVVPPVLCRLVQSRLTGAGADNATVLRRAAAWMEGRGETDRALAALFAAGTVAEAPPTAAVVEAGASLIRGDYDTALTMVRPLIAAEGPIPMAAGLVAGLVHHFRGQLDEATALYARALEGPGSEELRVMVLGWAAAAAWLVGDLERCRQLTKEAEQVAEATGDDRALAMARTAMGMVAAMDGDRQAMRHYERALAHAEAAHDHVQIVRIRNNRGSRYLSEGYYREALVELDEAVRLADLAGIGMLRGVALSNRGEALMGLGRLDEAARELEAAKADYERLGSRNASYALAHLGTVHRLQGHLTLARAHYEDAIAVGEASRNHQGLVPALAGLALTVLDSDPEAAIRLSERAAAATSLARPEALVAAAEAAIRVGDLATASTRAEEASTAARTLRDRPALAEALEVQARVSPEPEAALGLLEEAAAIWRTIGNPLGEARVLLAQARLGGPHAHAAAAQAEQAFRRLGAKTLASEAARVQADLASAARPFLSVRVLGGFAVERDGTPVSATEWQSRKARDLLKVLIARRGHPVPREVLIDLLWEDEDPAKASSRLSVTLSTLRAVLDPAKKFDAEQFVANNRVAIWVRLENVTVDVEAFLTSARAGLDALSAGDTRTAAALLAAAEGAYGGDFLEEDLYEDWAVVLREEARTTYVSVTMALADLALAAGDHDAAARYLLRVLARDPYDERAHLHLVAALSGAGRHGEARRMYRAYCGRMADIGVEPAPFPSDSAVRRAARPGA